MSLYHQIFTEATGICNPAALVQIENVVRISHPTLDHLSKEELMYEAQIAVEALNMAFSTH